MLKLIVFENFVYFKDKIIIKFNIYNEDVIIINKILN